MSLADLLDLADLKLVEPLFSDLQYLEMDDLLLVHSSSTGRILVDENENPALFALESKDGPWMACSTLYRAPSVRLIDYFDTIEWEMYQENRNLIEDSIRADYSNKLLDTVTPATDDLNPAREQSIRKLIRDIIKNESGISCLDCCCGTGVGSRVMEQNNLKPVAYDNDESLLARGIITGRLKPEHTMWIDGRDLDQFLSEPVPLACGFMFGEIHPFNAQVWQEIIAPVCRVSDKILITTGTEPEITRIKGWVEESGKQAETFETDFDPIYERWVCYSE